MFLGSLIETAIYRPTLPVHALWYILLLRLPCFHSMYLSDFNCSEVNEIEYSYVTVG
jgi:hypothetical protein